MYRYWSVPVGLENAFKLTGRITLQKATARAAIKQALGESGQAAYVIDHVRCMVCTSYYTHREAEGETKISYRELLCIQYLVGTMMDLPNETLIHILEYVDANDLPAVLSTCQRIHDLRGYFVPHVLRAAFPDQQALDACLMRGVVRGDVHAVRPLLSADADVDTVGNDDGKTALYRASQWGY